MQKNAIFFSCEKCNFKCSNKFNYSKHLMTLKHLNTDAYLHKTAEKMQYICNCGKKYKHRQSLFSHKNKCIIASQSHAILNTDESGFTNIVLEILKSNQDMQKQIMDVCKNIQPNNITTNNNNSHNKTFNLNMFLNEQCKDAMNLTDFVDSLQFQLSDLEKIGELGYVAGLSNMIIRNLKALDVFKRPVHCSDTKRETIFIKEADKWEKENEDNEKLNKAIKIIANKNIRMIPKWREKYPECAHSDSCKSDQYNNIIIQSLDTNPNSNHKIISNIAKEIKIDKLSIQ